MFVTFPADEKVKARLDSVCKSIGITYEQWFEKALIGSEYYVLVRFLGNPEESTVWKWDEELCQFIRPHDAE